MGSLKLYIYYSSKNLNTHKSLLYAYSLDGKNIIMFS